MNSTTVKSLVTSSSTEGVDLSQYYYRAECKNATGKNFVCLIPLHLISQDKINEAINNGLSSSDPANMTKPMKDRLICFEKHWKKQIVIVEHPKRMTDSWVFKRLYKTRNGQVKVIECTKEFERMFSKPLKEALEQKSADTKVILTQAGSSMQVTSSSTFIQQIPMDKKSGETVIPTGPQFMATLKALKRFQESIGKLVSRYGSQLCPSEPIRLIWDSLSQSIVYHHPMSEETRTTLSKKLLDYWQEVQSHLNYFLDGAVLDDPKKVYEGLQQLIRQLEILSDYLSPIITEDNPVYSRQMQVTDPLKEWTTYVAGIFPSMSTALNSPLSQKLLTHWKTVEQPITLFLNGCREENLGMMNTGLANLVQAVTVFKRGITFTEVLNSELYNQLLCVVEKLETFSSGVLEQFPCLLEMEAIEHLENLVKSIPYIIAFASSMSDIRSASYYFHRFNQGALKDIENISIGIHSQPEALKRWLEFRISTLGRYLEMGDRQDPIDVIIIQGCQTISDLIRNRQWVKAYETMDLLKQQTNVLINSRQLHETVNKKEGVVGTISFSKEDFKILRHIHFIRAFLSDFRFCIEHGKLFSIVSQETHLEMIDSYEGVSRKVPPRINHPFVDWLKQLARFENKQLQKELAHFRDSWKALREIKKGLMQDQVLKSQLQMLYEQIRAELYQDLHSTYLEITHRLNEPIKVWEEQLKQISAAIENIHMTALVLLYDPKAPPIETGVLQEGFSLLNQQLLQVVQPVTQLMNAFQQLICMGNTPSSASSSGELLFTKEGSFTLSLFPEDTDYFQQLAEELVALRPSQKGDLEIESSSSSSPSDAPAVLFSSTILSTVKEIFCATKRNKIETDITTLLTTNDISYRIETGKGSHFKLYIEGINVPIILPVHKEWKPGTKKSIENSLLEQLRVMLYQVSESQA